MYHAIDGQIFNADNPKAIDDLPTPLVGEVLAPIGDTLVNLRDNVLVPDMIRRVLHCLAEFALHPRQIMLIFAEEAGIGNRLTGGERGKTGQANIHADSIHVQRQGFRLIRHREAGEPLTTSGMPNGQGLDCISDGAMKLDLEIANLSKVQLAIFQAKARLGIGERVIAAITPEAGIARFFASLDTTKEGFESKVNTDTYILQDLRVNGEKLWMFLFPNHQSVMRIIQTNRYRVFFPCFFAEGQGLIIHPSAFLKGLRKLASLCFCWIQAILVRFTHNVILAQILQFVKGAIHPPFRKQGHSGPRV